MLFLRRSERDWVEHVRNRRAFWNGEDEFGEFALRGLDRNVMESLDDAGRWRVELREFCMEHRLFLRCVAAARHPSDPGVVHRREDERGHGIFANGLAIHRNGHRRRDIDVEIGQRERE